MEQGVKGVVILRARFTKQGKLVREYYSILLKSEI